MGAPVVIEVRDVHKVFRVPDQRIDSLKERATHPFQRIEHRELRALESISFDVLEGEFFGIVGRNGSGKSTLLKILASIYAADRGSVRMAGRVAPFIELGVGFNPELPARENVALNGVLMGLSRGEAARRYEEVMDFAELREFADLKVKNYSSGMMVRLAFAIMVQADADIMLIDEVLAVGDAAFAQKCMDVFHERRRAGKTVVLVTHDMATVNALCHRAMLLHEGEQQFLGEPEEAAIRYFRRNFAGPVSPENRLGPEDEGRTAVPDYNVSVLHAHLRDAAGVAVENVEQGTPVEVEVEVEALRDLRNAAFIFHLRNEEDITIFRFTRRLDGEVAKGGRVRMQGTIENRLVPGSYSLDCWVRRDRTTGDMAVQGLRLLSFVVFGVDAPGGVVTLETDLTVSRTP